MNDIIRHIEYLLVTNDCVIIPGIGAILAHTMPAQADMSKSLVTPPGRVYSFDPSLNHNDGKLTASLARANNVGSVEASEIVATQTKYMRDILNEEKELSFGRIGSLKLSGDVASFVPSSVASSFSPDTMWLSRLHLRNLKDVVKERRAIEVIRHRQNGKGRILHFVSKVGRVAASLALLAAVGFVVSTPITVDNAQYASVSIENFKPTEPKTAGNQLIRRPGELTAPLKLVLNSNADGVEIVDTAAHNEYIRRHLANVSDSCNDKAGNIDENSQPRIDKNDKYFLIVASLTTQSDAEAFIMNSRTQNLGILAKDGRYRVYAASGETMQQVNDASRQLAGQYPDSWICRR